MQNIKLFVFDIDNTISYEDSIWEVLHKECGTWESHGNIFLKQYKKNKIDFDEFARRDAKTWKNISTNILNQAIRKVKITPGFKELIKYLKTQNIKTAIISCSLKQFADYLAEKFNLDFIYANELETVNAKLTGEISLEVGGNKKEATLLKLIKELHLKKEEVAVIGDSEFDLPMMHHTPHSFIIRNEKFKKDAKYFINDFFDVIKLLQTGTFGS